MTSTSFQIHVSGVSVADVLLIDMSVPLGIIITRERILMSLIDEYRPGRAVPKMKRFNIVAGKMERVLKMVVRDKKITETTFPANLLPHTQGFFAEMEQILSSQEHVVSLHLHGSQGYQNYEIARYLLAKLDRTLDEAKLRTRLIEMSTLAEKMESTQELTLHEVDIAIQLLSFFKEMKEIGEMEYYEERMEESHRGMP